MERYLGQVVLQGCASWTTELVVWCESEFVHVLYLYRGECRLVSKCLGCWALGGTNPSGGGGCWGVVGGGGSGSGGKAVASDGVAVVLGSVVGAAGMW